MSSIVSEIKDFLAHGRTSDALSRLLDLSQSNKQIHDSILMVLAEFNDLNAARLRGTIHNEEATVRQNKINEKVLMALDSFDSQGRVLPGSLTKTRGDGSKILGKVGVYILLSGISLALIGGLIVLNNEHSSLGWGLIIAAYYIVSCGLLVLGGWVVAVILDSLKGK